jgi:hypothetical protein
MQVNAMKEKLQPKDKTLLTEFKSDYDKRIANAATSGDLISEHNLLTGMVMALDSISDSNSFYRKQLIKLEADNELKNAIAANVQRQHTEYHLQEELSQQFSDHDEKWWATKIAELNLNIKSATNPKESQMYRRLVNYLGLIGYMNVNHALSQGDLESAATYLKIFKMADPENPDCSYLSALYFMKTNKSQQALGALNDAATLGYSEAAQLITNPAFSSLQSDEAFHKIIIKVRENAMK